MIFNAFALFSLKKMRENDSTYVANHGQAVRVYSDKSKCRTHSLSLSSDKFQTYQRQKNTYCGLVLIEWKKRVLLVIIKKHDTIDERRIIISKCREIERVNIYIWMEIIDWKCSNEMNQCVYKYVRPLHIYVRDGQLTQICSLYRAHVPP